jgi:flagellar basal body-associated protein FliL
MAKDSSSNLHVTIIGVLLVALLACVSFYVRLLGQRVDAQSEVLNSQSEKITKLDKSFAMVVGVLNTKMPSANLPALLTLSSEKNTPPNKVATLIPMLETNTKQAKVYLKDEMYFNPQEVNAVIGGAPFLQKKPSMNIAPKVNNMPIN